MNSLTFYRIFSYILLVIGVFLGFFALIVLLFALSNPVFLISVFIIASVVIYSFTSFLFLVNGIDGQRYLKPKLKDWIKVNAYVAIFFVFMNIFQSISVITNPGLVNDALKQVTEMQKTASPLSADMMTKIVKAVVWFLLIYAVILGSHISSTFRLLKQYSHLFEKEPEGDNF